MAPLVQPKRSGAQRPNSGSHPYQRPAGNVFRLAAEQRAQRDRAAARGLEQTAREASKKLLRFISWVCLLDEKPRAKSPTGAEVLADPERLFQEKAEDGTTKTADAADNSATAAPQKSDSQSIKTPMKSPQSKPKEDWTAVLHTIRKAATDTFNAISAKSPLGSDPASTGPQTDVKPAPQTGNPNSATSGNSAAAQESSELPSTKEVLKSLAANQITPFPFPVTKQVDRNCNLNSAEARNTRRIVRADGRVAEYFDCWTQTRLPLGPRVLRPARVAADRKRRPGFFTVDVSVSDNEEDEEDEEQVAEQPKLKKPKTDGPAAAGTSVASILLESASAAPPADSLLDKLSHKEKITLGFAHPVPKPSEDKTGKAGEGKAEVKAAKTVKLADLIPGNATTTATSATEKPEAESSAESSAKSAPAFSFGLPKSSAEGTGEKSASSGFGSSGIPKLSEPKAAGFLFGAQKDETGKPAETAKPFSFGSSAETEKKTEKPAFSFSIPKPAVAEKSGESESGEDATKKSATESLQGSSGKLSATPAFSFGKSSTEKSETPKDSATPAFSFGKPGTDDKEASKPSATPAFSFGKPGTDDKEASKSSATPAFSFGKTGTDGTETSKPLFSSSAFTNSSKDATKSTSGDTTKMDKETPKPAFSFGAAPSASQPQSADKPLFSFGAKTSETSATTSDNPAEKPAFSAAPKPSLPSFGSSAPAPTSAFPSASATKPSFSFSGAAPKADNQPATVAQPAKSGFSFKLPADSSAPKPPTGTERVLAKPMSRLAAKGGFSRSASPADNGKRAFDTENEPSKKPMFSFGGGAAEGSKAGSSGGAGGPGNPFAFAKSASPMSGAGGAGGALGGVFGGANGAAGGSKSESPAAFSFSGKPSTLGSGSGAFSFSAPSLTGVANTAAAPGFSAPPLGGAASNGSNAFGFSAPQANTSSGSTGTFPAFSAPSIPAFGTPAAPPVFSTPAVGSNPFASDLSPAGSVVPGRRIAPLRRKKR